MRIAAITALMITLMSTSAYAEGVKSKFSVVSETRVEYQMTKNEHKFTPSVGVRFNTDMKDKYTVFIVPRLRYGTPTWNIGPEFRIPTSKLHFNKKYILLFRAQFRVPVKD